MLKISSSEQAYQEDLISTLPATTLSPSRARTFHEKFELDGLMRDTSPLKCSIKKYHRIIQIGAQRLA